ncbi:MAG TPA: hypothetical protein VF188_11655 [Longimicrobiales bacterium]
MQPFGSFINVLPPVVFIVIHLALLALGLFMAFKSAGGEGSGIPAAFGLYALAEVFYLSYHLDLTVIIFAHTIAEVLDAVAFLLLFGAVGKKVLASRAGAGYGETVAR